MLNVYTMGIIWDLDIVGINICHYWVLGFLVIGWLHLGYWWLIVIVHAGRRGLVHVNHWVFPALVLLVRHDWLVRDGGSVFCFWLVLEQCWVLPHLVIALVTGVSVVWWIRRKQKPMRIVLNAQARSFWNYID